MEEKNQFPKSVTIYTHIQYIEGAAGYIKFNEVERSVNIFQIQSSQPALVGVYNPNDNVTLNKSQFLSAISSDRFETVYEVLPQWMMVCIFSIWTVVYHDNSHFGAVPLLEI